MQKLIEMNLNDPWVRFRILLTSSLIGFLIGFCVPTWYRKAPRELAGKGIEIVEARVKGNEVSDR